MGFSPRDFLLLQRLYTRYVNLTKLLTRLLRRPQADEPEPPFSIVLLLRQSLLFTEDQLNAAGQRAWNVPFSDADGSMYCVVQATPTVTLIKSGKYLFNLIQEDSFYLGPVEEIAMHMPRLEQKEAWRQHKAWAALDLMNEDVPKKEAYASLARWGVELETQNCAGIYLPKASIFFPNDGTAKEGLERLIKKGPSNPA
jgi:hypothetical protein